MNIYKRHRFPPVIISYTVWLYYRFNLSHRDIENLLAEHGVTVSYEAIRLWCIKFGTNYARRLKRKHRGYGDTLYIDEVFAKTQGKQHYLWRAIDKMARWLMYTSSLNEMGSLLSVSSKGCCGAMVENPGR